MNTETQNIDVRLYLAVNTPRPGTEWFDNHYIPVEETDAEAFLERSLRRGRPACCSMTAAFSITLDDLPWDTLPEDVYRHNRLDALDWNALDTTIELVDVMQALCDGAGYAEVNPHDDEWPLLFVRDVHDQVRFCTGDAVLTQVSIPLSTLAPLVLREGKKLALFLDRLQSLIESRLKSVELDKKAAKPLLERKELLAAFNWENRLAKLESSLAKLAHPRPIHRKWSDLTSLLVEFPSHIDRTFTQDRDKLLYHTVVTWPNLPEAEIEWLRMLVTHTSHATSLRFRLPEHGFSDQFYWLEFQAEGSKVMLSFSSEPPQKPKTSTD